MKPSQDANGRSRYMLMVAVVTVGVFLVISGRPAVSILVVTAGALGLLTVASVATLSGRSTTALTILAFLTPLQPAIRLLAPNLPYLLFWYWLPLLALSVVFQSPNRSPWCKSTLFLGAFVLIELADSARSDSWMAARAVLCPTLGLFSMLVIGDKLRLRRSQVQTIIAAFLAGTAGLAALIATAYLTGQASRWVAASSFGASAGMGPNQVSLLLAVASFLALVTAGRARPTARIALWVGVGILVLLMILTFSRGGLYLLTGAVAAYHLLFAKPSAKRLATVVGFGVAAVLLLQFATSITGGMAATRYLDTSTTNRLELLRQSWNIFLDNPMIGIGTGRYFQAVGANEYFGSSSGAHNELGRAAAEHGVFGLLTWGAFAVFSVVAAWSRSRSSDNERALRTTLAVLALTIMVYNGLKLITPPLLLFLSMVQWSDNTVTQTRQRMPRAFARRLHRRTSADVSV